jgi:two-component system sensor histidine kinase KdpD
LTLVGFFLQTNQLTISLVYLLVVVGVASLLGIWQATFASIVAVLLLDYYFEPPLFSLAVESPSVFVALLTFEVIALAISGFQSREMRTAREAAIQRTGMEQLYELSRSTLLLDLRQPPGPQLAVLIQRVFDTDAVALFDSVLGRLDSVGEWRSDEEGLAKDCFLRDVAHDDPATQTFERLLLAGSERVGALVVRGRVSSLVVNALAALAAIAIDRHESFEKEERAETAKQSEQLRAAVMDALAHEFKTPLAAVQTASSGLLDMGGLTATQEDLVTLIDGEAIRLNSLCTRLLRTAKLDQARIDLDTDDVNVKGAISKALVSHSTESEINDIQVAVDEPGLTVRADRELFGMILTQFIDNARKYSRRGTPIEIAAQQSSTEVLISVHNFGPTIPIEDRERIFERFYRSPETKNIVPGTGIGLSAARKAAEANHGHVWVVSDDKEGTTFYLSLPNGVRGMR